MRRASGSSRRTIYGTSCGSPPQDAEGRVYLSAARFDGEDAGQFEYHGTRSDDPNDIYPHEHRRELRANRVVAAWLAHDDSSALNTRNVRVKTDRPAATSATTCTTLAQFWGARPGSPSRPPAITSTTSRRSCSLTRLFTARSGDAEGSPRQEAGGHPPVGRLCSKAPRSMPERWKANYPNPAFSNMQPDDAFWGARLVSRFSDEAIQAIVASAGYDDPEAVRYLVSTLIQPPGHHRRHWLNGVNPVVDVSLSPEATLTFSNAAVAAGVATEGRYTIAWARFDNNTGASERIAVEKTAAPRGTAPAVLLSNATYIAATIWSEHPNHPGWAEPVRVYFRKDGEAWKTVGLYRRPD